MLAPQYPRDYYFDDVHGGSLSYQWALSNTGQYINYFGTTTTSGADIDAPEAWGDFTTGSSNVIVAILDSGLDRTHIDLQANYWVNSAEDPAQGGIAGFDDDGNGYVDDIYGWKTCDIANDDLYPGNNGEPGTGKPDVTIPGGNPHGTGVGGIVGAEGDGPAPSYSGISGVMWNVSLMNVIVTGFDVTNPVSSERVTVNWFEVLMGLEYAHATGAHVVNMSFQIATTDQGFYNSMVSEYDRRYFSGILEVVGAGNDGAYIGLTGKTKNHATRDVYLWPAGKVRTDRRIIVAMTDYNDAIDEDSNYGINVVDLAAPGSEVYSLSPGSSYAWFWGTSFAAPHAAGVAGLVLSHDSSLFLSGGGVDTNELRARILRNVDSVSGLSGLLRTGGRLNAWKAISDPGG